MSDQRLRELLQDLAEPVPAPRLSDATLRGAQRVRRQRRTAVVAAAAAGVAVTVVAVSVGSSPEPRSRVATPPAAASASPSQFGPFAVDVAPVGSEGRLARLDVGLPTSITLDPRRALKLSAALVDRAVALLQAGEDQTTVYLLGSDRKLRVLDTVALKAPEDEFGNAQGVLDSTSLAPDGKRAAFAQRDEIVVVDLRTGAVQRLPLKGFSENVLWQPDAQGLIVEQADKTFMLDLRTGAIRQPFYSFDTAATVAAAGGNIVQLGSSDGDGSALTQWTPAGVLVGKTRLPAPWRSARNWYGPGWRNADLVARSVFAPVVLEPSGAGEATVAVEVATGKVVRALLFPRAPGGVAAGRKLQCCEVRGWLGQDTVVIQNLNRLLAWNVRTGALNVLTQLSPGVGVLSLADLVRR